MQSADKPNRTLKRRKPVDAWGDTFCGGSDAWSNDRFTGDPLELPPLPETNLRELLAVR